MKAARPARGPAAVVLDAAAPADGGAALGGKGAALGRLVAWGFPVPPTAVVTTAVGRRLSEHPAVVACLDRLHDAGAHDAGEIDAVFGSAPLAEDDRAAILDAARRIAGGHHLAVRSSATVEDLAESSFAGQYRSVLDVDPADEGAVLDAVRAVLASLWHPAPRAYRRAFGVADDEAAMAVVLMAMVPAVRAGVVFTVDPGGAPDRARIEVVEGLGESLVSGAATPTAHLVARAPAERPADLDPVVAEALDLSLRIEALDGRPQDVEWAWDGERTWIVQARPITVAPDSTDPFDDPLTDHELTTAGIGEMLPGVIPPLVWQLAAHLVDEAFARVLAELGALPDDPAGTRRLVHRVRGRAALDFDLLREFAARIPGAAVEELESQYFGSGRTDRPTAPPGGRQARWRHLAHDLHSLATRRRVVGDADTVSDAAEHLAADGAVVDGLGSLDDAELWALRARLVDLGARAMGAELGVAAVAASVFRRLELTLVPHLGADRATAAAARVTTAAAPRAVVAPGASAAIFAGPTWAELGRAPTGGAVGPAEVGDARFAELVAELADTPTWGRGELRRLVATASLRRLAADAADQLRRRERTKAAVLGIGGAVRVCHLELGRRLAERGLLADARDVDLLGDLELRRALAGDAPTRATLQQRRRALERAALDPPLPARFRGRPEVAEVTWPDGDRIEGWAASAGRASGLVEVVRDPALGVTAGRVLVAEATDASWSPLFVDAAGIVLERGGPLSHAAILARELGVPAVLNVAGATRRLVGRRVLVDGDAGVVVVLDDDGSEP